MVLRRVSRKDRCLLIALQLKRSTVRQHIIPFVDNDTILGGRAKVLAFKTEISARIAWGRSITLGSTC